MTLETVWDRIAAVSELTFRAVSGTSAGWAGVGIGTVDVSQPVADMLVYNEAGTWTPSGDEQSSGDEQLIQQLAFTNVYRWTRLAAMLRLEHLRFGADNPVYLFDLAIVDDSRLESVEPHV